MANILEKAISPDEARDMLARKGIAISTRTLKERARKIGACRVLGNCVFFLPEHLDRIFEEPKPCRDSTSATEHGGTPSPLPGSDAGDLRKRLTRNSPRISRQKKNGGNVTQLSTARNQS